MIPCKNYQSFAEKELLNSKNPAGILRMQATKQLSTTDTPKKPLHKYCHYEMLDSLFQLGNSNTKRQCEELLKDCVGKERNAWRTRDPAAIFVIWTLQGCKYAMLYCGTVKQAVTSDRQKKVTTQCLPAQKELFF